MLTSETEEYLQKFQEATKGVDLELVYKDEVYQQLEDFADREMEAKIRENRLAIQSQQMNEQEILTQAVDYFRSQFEKKLVSNKNSTQLKQELERHKQGTG